MKKYIGITLLFCCMIFSATANAGTLLIGPKGWYGIYADGAQRLAFFAGVNEHGNNLSSGTLYDNEDDRTLDGSGKGSMLGLLVGYQTDDKKWALSLAPMMSINMKFKESQKGYIFDLDGNNDTTADQYPVNIEITEELTRIECDSIITRSVTDWFKIFAGYKVQYFHSTGTSTATVMNGSTVLETSTVKTEVTMKTHFPVLGAGLAFSFFERFSLGFNFGAGPYMGSGSYKVGSIAKNVKIEPVAGFVGDINLSVLVSDSVVLQTSGKMQAMVYNMTNDIKATTSEISEFGYIRSGYEYGTHSESDIFFGITFAAILMFDI